MSIPTPIPLKVPGGTFVLGPVEVESLFSPMPSAKTSLALDGFDPGPLLSEIWRRPVEGRIEGRLDPVQFRQNRLTAGGKIHADIFGGRVVIEELGVSGLLSPAPVLELNSTWDDLDLASLTEGTSFGKIQGILKGRLRGLEVAYGQPQSFELTLETVKTPGVPQKISVKAVDNIARIGGGQSPFIGIAGTFSSLFREFPYKKIGVHASLKNDLFRVNGTIKEDGKEYLVKRGGFSGVNIVNQNPDNRIGFKDMVKRIRRMWAADGGPVVR
jgi:hypothetical protein